MTLGHPWKFQLFSIYTFIGYLSVGCPAGALQLGQQIPSLTFQDIRGGHGNVTA